MLIWLSYQSGGETELGEILSRLQREARQVLLKHGYTSALSRHASKKRKSCNPVKLSCLYLVNLPIPGLLSPKKK